MCLFKQMQSKGRVKKAYTKEGNQDISYGRGTEMQSTATWNVILNLILPQWFIFFFALGSYSPSSQSSRSCERLWKKKNKQKVIHLINRSALKCKAEVESVQSEKTRANTVLWSIITKYHESTTSFCSYHPMCNPFQFTESEKLFSISAGIGRTVCLPAR